MIANTATWP